MQGHRDHRDVNKEDSLLTTEIHHGMLHPTFQFESTDLHTQKTPGAFPDTRYKKIGEQKRMSSAVIAVFEIILGLKTDTSFTTHPAKTQSPTHYRTIISHRFMVDHVPQSFMTTQL